MAEIAFYVNEEDEQRVLSMALASGYWLIPDLRYDAPEYEVAFDMTAYLGFKTATTLFYIGHDDWFVSSMEMFDYIWQHDGRQHYAVEPRSVGPTMLWITSRRYRKGGHDFYSSGNLGFYPWYADRRTDGRYPAPQALKASYRRIAAEIRRRSRILVTEEAKRRYYVCHGAAAEALSGAVRLGGVFEERATEDILPS